MIEGEYIKNNTVFAKPSKKSINGLFLRNVVFITSDRLRENLETLMMEKDINTIRLTDDYKLDNLDFLNDYDLSFIRSIDVLSDSIKNIDGLYNLLNIESINSTNQNIDYSRFPKLRSIGGELSSFSYITLLNVETLETIGISNKFKEKDVTIFSKNKGLKYLMLRGSKITSLKGLENFKELRCLELFHNNHITSLEGITEEHNESLKEISIYKASKLFYVDEYLSKLPNLEHLQLECKKVDSFRFLNSLRNLKLLSIHNKLTQVEDGDKIPLIEGLERTNGKIW
ncbi:leucine-rich repeat domain-containing protein [Flavobacterium yafengii]|uniref:leucine-rich repeat domain-containing protein n=1 Tax=Flavobacterium yafengii TaxID=3041253 RepID=UPI0024A805C8|nr:leucine-rich repeat domain-containing protein [Flavobacterium yafengii]MDI5887639.1 hypothetical protein [Flavobacterium yafengii]